VYHQTALIKAPAWEVLAFLLGTLLALPGSRVPRIGSVSSLLAGSKAGAAKTARRAQSTPFQVSLAVLAALATLAIQLTLYHDEINPAIATVTLGMAGIAFSHLKFGPPFTAAAVATLCTAAASAFLVGSLCRTSAQLKHDLDAISDGWLFTAFASASLGVSLGAQSATALPSRLQLLAAASFPLLLMSGARIRHARTGDERELGLPFDHAVIPFSSAFGAMLLSSPIEPSLPRVTSAEALLGATRVV